MKRARYTAKVSDADLLALKSLIGRSIGVVYAPCLQVGRQDLTSPSFSIPISDEIDGRWLHRYIVVRCEWYETPKTLTDYWQMLVGEETKPHGIEVDSEKGLLAPCTVQFWEAKPIIKVEVYSWAGSSGHGDDLEEVEFDQAIRIWMEDGRSICVACQLNGPGIATEVHISEDEKTISDYLKDSRCRLTIFGSA